jgi:hypothetical protein
MKPKDRMFPTVESYQLQLREVASEPHPQQLRNRSGAARYFTFNANVVDYTCDPGCKSTTTRH